LTSKNWIYLSCTTWCSEVATLCGMAKLSPLTCALHHIPFFVIEERKSTLLAIFKYMYIVINDSCRVVKWISWAYSSYQIEICMLWPIARQLPAFSQPLVTCFPLCFVEFNYFSDTTYKWEHAVVSSCGWLIFFTMSSGFIHTVTNDRISFFVKAC
jgi:hypothetical protein